VGKVLRIKDWRDFICSDSAVFNDCKSIESALKMIIELNIEEYFPKLLFYLENESAFKSYFTKTESQKTDAILQ
jgi:hypothetical protein